MGSITLDGEMWMPVLHFLNDARKYGAVVAASVTVSSPGWFRRQRPVLRMHFETEQQLDAFHIRVKTWSGFESARTSTVIDIWPKWLNLRGQHD